MKIASLAILGLLLLTIVVATGLYYTRGVQDPEQTVCTMEAKLCPDGSYVGRTGPQCEFSACPSEGTPNTSLIDTSTWKTYWNETYGFTVRYPIQAEINVLDNMEFLGEVRFELCEMKNCHPFLLISRGAIPGAAPNVVDEPKYIRSDFYYYFIEAPATMEILKTFEMIK